MSVAEQTEAAIVAAVHLTKMDHGALESLRTLAHKIDTDDELREAYLMYRKDRGDESIRPLQMDNVSIPTYLKYCESLGLTPAGRAKLGEKKPEGSGGGKLGDFQAAARRKRGA